MALTTVITSSRTWGSSNLKSGFFSRHCFAKVSNVSSAVILYRTESLREQPIEGVKLVGTLQTDIELLSDLPIFQLVLIP